MHVWTNWTHEKYCRICTTCGTIWTVVCGSWMCLDLCLLYVATVSSSVCRAVRRFSTIPCMLCGSGHLYMLCRYVCVCKVVPYRTMLCSIVHTDALQICTAPCTIWVDLSAMITCEIKVFQPEMSDWNDFISARGNLPEIISKLFQKLIATHECFQHVEYC